VPDVPGVSDPEEVLRARRKLIAVRRAQRRLENRLADIDWEFDTLKPEVQAFEKRVTVLGELPDFTVVAEAEDSDGNSPENP